MRINFLNFILIFCTILVNVSCNPDLKNTEDGKKSAIEKILISPQKLDSVDLPKALLYKGEFVDGFKWKDSEGEKLVFIIETGEYPTPTNKEYSTDAELYAYCYLKHGNDYVLS